jgi:iron complex outermembrane receptor protein
MQWVAGLYYFEEDTDFDNPVLLPALTVGALNNAGTLETTSFAVFGQVTNDLTDELHLTGGVRYTDEEKLATPMFSLSYDVTPEL